MVLIDDKVISSNTYEPALDLYPVCRSLSRMSNAHSLRVMYLLHKICRHTPVKDHPVIEIPIQELISYLGIEAEEDPLELIQKAIFYIMENPIHIVRLRSGEDPRTWNGCSWIIDYIFSSSLQKIYLHINPAVQKYLLLLDALDHVRLDSILRISRTFPVWLYITLTNASRYGKYWVVSTDIFAKMSMIEDREVWTVTRIGRDTLRVQLGAFTTPAVKEEFTKARKGKRDVHFIPWEIRKGNILTVRTHSELQFNICTLKKWPGAAYSHYVFSFNPSDDAGMITPPDLENLPTIAEEFQKHSGIMGSIKLLTLNYLPR